MERIDQLLAPMEQSLVYMAIKDGRNNDARQVARPPRRAAGITVSSTGSQGPKAGRRLRQPIYIRQRAEKLPRNPEFDSGLECLSCMMIAHQ
jgi:hypothetical protein